MSTNSTTSQPPVAAAETAAAICGEIAAVFAATPDPTYPSTLSVLVGEIASAAQRGSVFVHGVGREGLMLRALCMRLAHLGLAAHAVGDVTAPPAAAGDLLIASAGPGRFSTVDAICAVARKAGARVVLLTARPDAGGGAAPDAIAYLPARTMVDGEEEASSPSAARLPMGSLYEGAMFVLFEMVVMRLAEVLGQSPAQMRARHTNLE